MSEVTSDTFVPTNAAAPPDPTSRFSLRALLWATTVVTILAAVLAPLYRAQTVSGGIHLLIVWAVALIWPLTAHRIQNYSASKKLRETAAERDDVLYQFHVLPSTYRDALNRPVRLIIRSILVAAAAIIYSSADVSEKFADDQFVLRIPSAVVLGWFVGSFLTSTLFHRTAAFVLFRESGVNLDMRRIPWTYIRDVNWLSRRPNILLLHRYDDDVLVHVPARIHDEVEAYVRQHVHTAGNPAFGELPAK